MILFFDCGKLVESSKGNALQLVTTLRKLANSPLGSKIRKKLQGHNFLSHPEQLLAAEVDVTYVYQYVVLAAKRDYTMYKLYGINYLPITDFPQLNRDAIKHNPLLRVNDKTGIHFKYEI